MSSPNPPGIMSPNPPGIMSSPGPCEMLSKSPPIPPPKSPKVNQFVAAGHRCHNLPLVEERYQVAGHKMGSLLAVEPCWVAGY